MVSEIASRVDFLVGDVARLIGRRFDRLAREQIGLSRAQCRLLAVLSLRKGCGAVNQAALAEDLDMTPMGVAKLCERMEAAGWIVRKPCATDRRVNLVSLGRRADAALTQALRIGDEIQQQALAGVSARDRLKFAALLQRVHLNLSPARPPSPTPNPDPAE